MWRAFVAVVVSGLLIGFAAGVSAAAPVPADGQPCEGTLEINGKTYKLKYAVAYACKVFDNEDAVSVLFSDNPIPVAKLTKALADGKGKDEKFFFFKPSVTVTFDKTGRPMFCNAWADNNSLSVSGGGLSGELAVKDGRAKGKVSLASKPDAERKNSFSIPSFDLALIPLPAEASKAENPKPAETKPAADAKPAPAPLHYKELALPDGAKDVEYKKIVGQIRCNAPGDVKTVVASLTKKLAAQGWETQGSDLVNKAATLRRKRGDATLTIFVKAVDDKTSGVNIMSTGLRWEEKKP